MSLYSNKHHPYHPPQRIVDKIPVPSKREIRMAIRNYQAEYEEYVTKCDATGEEPVDFKEYIIQEFED